MQTSFKFNHFITTVGVRKMYLFFMENLYEQARDMEPSDAFTLYKGCLEGLSALVLRDPKGIRDLFLEGYVYMLVPNFDESTHEIRVVDDENDDKLVVVIVGEEIDV